MKKEEVLLIWEKLAAGTKPLTKARRLEIIDKLRKEKHKKGVNPDDWFNVKNNLLLVAEFDLELSKRLGVYVEYTSIIRPKIQGVSTSDTHADGRAYDRTLRNCPAWLDPAWYAELVNDGLTVGAVSLS